MMVLDPGQYVSQRELPDRTKPRHSRKKKGGKLIQDPPFYDQFESQICVERASAIAESILKHLELDRAAAASLLDDRPWHALGEELVLGNALVSFVAYDY
jgi:hypothetical protein